jgi:hypothetical protein
MQHALILLAKAGRNDVIEESAKVASLRAAGRSRAPLYCHERRQRRGGPERLR